MTKKEDNFVERTKKHIEEKVNPLVNDALVAMFDKNVSVYDVHYIESRVRQILDEILKALTFDSKSILEARKLLFKKSIEKAKKIKIDLKKDKDKLADARNNKCEPVCKEIVMKLLDLDLLESDQQFFDEAISQDDELITQNRIRGFTDGLFVGLQFSLNHSLMLANKKLWGSDKEDIKMAHVDQILKQK